LEPPLSVIGPIVLFVSLFLTSLVGLLFLLALIEPERAAGAPPGLPGSTGGGTVPVDASPARV
jgi:hypothetical protein